MSFESNLRRLARRLSKSDNSLPPALRARILDNLPEREPGAGRVKGNFPVTTRRILLTAAAVSIATAGLLVGPRYFVKPSFAASEVRAAILKTNTWHFTGWRIKDGKKLNWEIWGRRSPFFYREQIGDEILMDDGKTRTHYVNERHQGKFEVRPTPGFVLIRKSERHPATLNDARNEFDARAGFLAGVNGDQGLRPSPGGSVLESSVTFGAGKSYIKEVSHLEVDPQTRLPLAYRVTQLQGKSSAVQAELIPEYDVALPENLPRPVWPEGTVVADMTVACDAPEARGDNAATRGGLTVAATVLARDAEGNVRIRLQLWLGHEPYSYERIPLILDFPRQNGANYGTDEQGTPYLFFSDSIDATSEICLTPKEPLAAGKPQPRKLRLKIPISLNVSAALGTAGYARFVPILEELFALTVDLPEQASDIGYSDPNKVRRFSGWRPSLRCAVAGAREDGYHLVTIGKLVQKNGRSYIIEKPSRKFRYERSAYWMEQAAEAALETKGGEPWAVRFRKNAEMWRKQAKAEAGVPTE